MENLNVNQDRLGTAPWSYLGSNTYYRSNTLPGGSYYTVIITNGTTPFVVARAYVQVGSFQNMAQNVSSALFAAVGVNPVPVTVTRAVRVSCAKPNPIPLELPAFTGILVAPYADVALKGGGNNNQDFCGTLMANSLTLNGHFSFHFDEALLGQKGSSRWLISPPGIRFHNGFCIWAGPGKTQNRGRLRGRRQ